MFPTAWVLMCFSCRVFILKASEIRSYIHGKPAHAARFTRSVQWFLMCQEMWPHFYYNPLSIIVSSDIAFTSINAKPKRWLFHRKYHTEQLSCNRAAALFNCSKLNSRIKYQKDLLALSSFCLKGKMLNNPWLWIESNSSAVKFCKILHKHCNHCSYVYCWCSRITYK